MGWVPSWIFIQCVLSSKPKPILRSPRSQMHLFLRSSRETLNREMNSRNYYIGPGRAGMSTVFHDVFSDAATLKQKKSPSMLGGRVVRPATLSLRASNIIKIHLPTAHDMGKGLVLKGGGKLTSEGGSQPLSGGHHRNSLSRSVVEALLSSVKSGFSCFLIGVVSFPRSRVRNNHTNSIEHEAVRKPKFWSQGRLICLSASRRMPVHQRKDVLPPMVRLVGWG